MTFKYICEYNTITCILQIDFKDIAFFLDLLYLHPKFNHLHYGTTGSNKGKALCSPIH